TVNEKGLIPLLLIGFVLVYKRATGSETWRDTSCVHGREGGIRIVLITLLFHFPKIASTNACSFVVYHTMVSILTLHERPLRQTKAPEVEVIME
ncbi:hypothetical protein LINPERPRIM_LOCUS25074, partial [Linum perenne]